MERTEWNELTGPRAGHDGKVRRPGDDSDCRTSGICAEEREKDELLELDGQRVRQFGKQWMSSNDD